MRPVHFVFAGVLAAAGLFSAVYNVATDAGVVLEGEQPSSLRFYCDADGAGPVAPIDWSARQRVVDAVAPDGIDETGLPVWTSRDRAQAELDAQRLGQTSHLVRNGNGPRTRALSPPELAAAVASGAHHLVLSEGIDEHGGRVVLLEDGEPLRCPECLAPVHALQLELDGGF